MIIGINGERLSTPNPAGPELYTINIIKALAEIDKENEYRVYLRNADKNLINEIEDLGENFDAVLIKKTLSWTQWDLLIELYKRPIDVFYSAVHTIPVLGPRGKTKYLSMIHGLEAKYVKPKNLWQLLTRGKHEWFVTAFSNKVVVPSQATKTAIEEKRWWCLNSDLTIIPEGVSEIFHKRDPLEIDETLEKYGLENKKFLLFVSTIQPRKNLPKLIEGFAKVANYRNFYLAVVGKLGWDYEESLNAPEKYKVKDRVYFLGRVDDTDLVNLYSGALAYVSASLEEGFGLPLLEAMASELPAAVSDIESYRIIGGDSVYYFDQNNADHIAEIIEKATNEDNAVEINMLKERAKQRAMGYTWERSAEKLLAEFEKLAQNT